MIYLWLMIICVILFLLFGTAKKKKKSSGGWLGPVIAIVILAGLFGAGKGIAGKVLHHSPAVPGNPSANVILGQRLAASYGWSSGSQWNCLYTLWEHESGWRMVWNTQGTGAYGIPQALPASKMASAGADYMTNPATQIRWGLSYIKSRYGTPCGAWDQYCSHPNGCWY